MTTAASSGVLAWLERHARTLLLASITIGVLLRVLLVACAPRAFGYIYDFYISAIEMTYWQRHVPLATACGECWQPPLFYIVAMPFFAFGRVLESIAGPDRRVLLGAVAALPVLCGSVCVLYGWRILRELRFTPAMVALGTGFLLVLPVLFFSTHGIEADILLGALMTALLYYGLRYASNPACRTIAMALVVAVLAALSAATKYSGVVGVAFAGILMAQPLVSTPSDRRAWRHLAILAVCVIVLSSWRYVDNYVRYGNPLFAMGTALEGFNLTGQVKPNQYEFFTFRFADLIALTRLDAPPGQLTNLPVYRSFWTAMYGMSWNDLGMFSNPTRHGDPTAPYGWRYVPAALSSAVLVLGLLPTALAVVGVLAHGWRRRIWPLALMTVLSALAYIPWVARQDSWAIKPKYLLFLAPVFVAFALFGLLVMRDRCPRWVTDTTVVAWLALLILTAAYLACFAVGLPRPS